MHLKLRTYKTHHASFTKFLPKTSASSRLMIVSDMWTWCSLSKPQPQQRHSIQPESCRQVVLVYVVASSNLDDNQRTLTSPRCHGSAFQCDLSIVHLLSTTPTRVGCTQKRITHPLAHPSVAQPAIRSNLLCDGRTDEYVHGKAKAPVRVVHH